MTKRTVDECFIQIRNGVNIKQGLYDGGFPITRIETIANDHFNRDRMGYAGITDVDKYESYILRDGDLLMSHINSLQYLGRTVEYKKCGDEIIIHGMNLLGLRPNRDIINPTFAQYAFRSSTFRQQLLQITKKSVNQASFTVSDLKKISIDIPNLSVQQSIVDVLEKTKRLIKQREQQIEIFNTLIKARFDEMFCATSGIKKIKLSEVVESGRIITYGMVKPGNDVPNGVIIIKVKDFPNGRIESNGFLHADPTLESKYARSRVKEGDLLFSIRGTVGRTAFVPKELMDANITQDTARLSIDQERFDAQFIRYALESEGVQREIETHIKGVAMRGISLAELREICIPYPDLCTQKEFGNFVIQVDKSKAVVQKAHEEAQMLYDSLMQQYFG